MDFWAGVESRKCPCLPPRYLQNKTLSRGYSKSGAPTGRSSLSIGWVFGGFGMAEEGLPGPPDLPARGAARRPLRAAPHPTFSRSGGARCVRQRPSGWQPCPPAANCLSWPFSGPELVQARGAQFCMIYHAHIVDLTPPKPGLTFCNVPRAAHGVAAGAARAGYSGDPPGFLTLDPPAPVDVQVCLVELQQQRERVGRDFWHVVHARHTVDDLSPRVIAPRARGTACTAILRLAGRRSHAGRPVSAHQS
eukprot:scaffold17553_cov112-Isochrysis_galbana.AAC.5